MFVPPGLVQVGPDDPAPNPPWAAAIATQIPRVAATSAVTARRSNTKSSLTEPRLASASRVDRGSAAKVRGGARQRSLSQARAGREDRRTVAASLLEALGAPRCNRSSSVL